jgi:hypothetical protein
MSVGPFNTQYHIKAAIEAVGEIAEFQKKNK